jgi:hypothetical protein
MGGSATPTRSVSRGRPSASISEHIRAYYDGTGNNGASADCDTLTINRAPTTTASAPDLSQSGGVYQAGTSVLFNLNFEVYSAYGIDPHNATGNVAAHQSDAALGCDLTDHGITQAQNDADGSGTAKAGFDFVADGSTNSGSRIGCTPTLPGLYTVYVSFTDTDGNYANSDDSPGNSVNVTTTQVQVCKAAPAIAADYLKNVLAVKKKIKNEENIVQLIANEMAMSQKARFPTYTNTTSPTGGALLRPCDNGYVTSVQNKTTYWANQR